MPANVLDITCPGQPNQTLELADGTTSIGRSQINGVVLEHPSISRRHAELRVDAGGIHVTDLGSSNGTRLNGTDLAPNQWQSFGPGDRVEVGPFTITLSQPQAAPQPEAPPLDAERTQIIDRSEMAQPAAPVLPPPLIPPPVEEVTPHTPPPPAAAPTPPSWARPVEALEPPSPPQPPVAPVPEIERTIDVRGQLPPREALEAAPALGQTIAAPIDQTIVAPQSYSPAQPAAASGAPGEPVPVYAQYLAQAAPAGMAGARAARRPAAASSGRNLASLALVVLAVVLTLPASLAFWEQHTLMNQNRFVATGTKVLDKPAVQQELARQLSKKVDTSLTGSGGLLSGSGLNGLGGLLNGVTGSGGTTTNNGAKPGTNGSTSSNNPDISGLLNGLLGSGGTTTNNGAKPGTSGNTPDLSGLLNGLTGGTSTNGKPGSGPDLSGLLNGVTGGSGSGGVGGLLNGVLGGNDDKGCSSPVCQVALSVIQSVPDSTTEGLLADAHPPLVKFVRDKNLSAQDSKITLNLDKELGDVFKQIGLPTSLAKVGLGNVTVLDRKDVSSYFDLLRFLDSNAVVFEALPIIFLVLGLLVAQDRPRYLLIGGGLLVAWSVFTLVVLKLPLKAILTSAVTHDDASKPAVKAAYDVISGGFVTQEIALLVAGVVIAVAGLLIVYSGAHPAPPRQGVPTA